jgi:hypothetical protein
MILDAILLIEGLLFKKICVGKVSPFLLKRAKRTFSYVSYGRAIMIAWSLPHDPHLGLCLSWGYGIAFLTSGQKGLVNMVEIGGILP